MKARELLELLQPVHGEPTVTGNPVMMFLKVMADYSIEKNDTEPDLDYQQVKQWAEFCDEEVEVWE